MTDREQRLAQNEAMFRDVNEQIAGQSQQWGIREDDGHEFLCECSDVSCTVHLRLSPSEYEEVRAHGARFFVAPGHEHPDIETVVEEPGSYRVVEKQGEAAELVDNEDPRG